MVDDVQKGQIERRTSRGWYEMMESQGTHYTNELVSFNKGKRKFLKLKDMVREDPDQLVMCEFKGQDFELVADQFDLMVVSHILKQQETHQLA